MVYSQTEGGSTPDGTFNMHVGPVDHVIFGQPLQFAFTIDSDPEMPREDLDAVPYALGLRGLRVQNGDEAPNLIGGHFTNGVASGISGATIGGGGGVPGNQVLGEYGTVGGGYQNTVNTGYGTIGGGVQNATTGSGSAVAGGSQNQATAIQSFIGGGYQNQASGDHSVVSGGVGNIVYGDESTIGGGEGNVIANGAMWGTVAGGWNNEAKGYYGTVAGGMGNVAGGSSSSIGGGNSNETAGTGPTVGGGVDNAALGDYSTVPGGRGNVAYDSGSFAAGKWARAHGNGSFVWQDATATSSDDSLASAATNQFRVRASGGIFLHTSAAPDLDTGAWLPGGSGTWGTLSSRDSKTAFSDVDTRDYLERTASLKLKEWSYKTEAGITHVGPMAEDFHQAFGLGPSEKSISTVDADGVALAAIQELYKLVKEQQEEIHDLKTALRKAGIAY
jgi:hypothetical protein